VSGYRSAGGRIHERGVVRAVAALRVCAIDLAVGCVVGVAASLGITRVATFAAVAISDGVAAVLGLAVGAAGYVDCVAVVVTLVALLPSGSLVIKLSPRPGAVQTYSQTSAAGSMRGLCGRGSKACSDPDGEVQRAGRADYCESPPNATSIPREIYIARFRISFSGGS